MTYFEYDCVFALHECIGKTQIGTKIKIIKTNGEELILGLGYRPYIPLLGSEPNYACFFDDDFKNIKINLRDIEDILPILEE